MPPVLANCTFYQSIDLPGIGSQSGLWDLRPGISDYLGDIDLQGRRVLEIGTANGFVCFEMERRGADVVGFDLDESLTYDAPPHSDAYLRPDAYRADLRRIRNAWWLAHHAFRSKASVAYGHANRIPPALGRFDVGVLANVMQHLQDPIGALMGLAAICDEAVVVTETDWMRGHYEDAAAMIYFDKDDPYVWYQVKPLLVEAVLKRMGFKSIARTEHTQIHKTEVQHGATDFVTASMDAHVPHYTVVARR